MLCEVLHKEMLDQLREHVKRSPLARISHEVRIDILEVHTTALHTA
jgi:hypothetical protein